jgi:hypothetical protein
MKDLKLEALRKELQSVGKQLDGQATGPDSRTRKATPQQKRRLKVKRPKAEVRG